MNGYPETTLTERFDRLMAAARQDRQTVGDL